MKTDSSRTFTILSTSFVTSIVALFGWLALALIQSKNDVLIVLVLVALVVAGTVYFVSLGILAKRTGGNWVVWVGLSILSFPLGPVVAYFLMWRRINTSNI